MSWGNTTTKPAAPIRESIALILVEHEGTKRIKADAETPFVIAVSDWGIPAPAAANGTKLNAEADAWGAPSGNARNNSTKSGSDSWGTPAKQVNNDNDSWGAKSTGSYGGGGGYGGGGQSYGGGGGDRPSGCFNCGEEGHNKSDCPNPPKARDITCYNCNQQGHGSRDCPEERQERGACFNCGQVGHNKNDCPEPPKERDYSDMQCYNCKGMGHGSRECPEEPREKRDISDMKCYNCGEMGHGSGTCPQPKKQVTCYNCGEEGHTSKHCGGPARPRFDAEKGEGTMANSQPIGEAVSEQVAAAQSFWAGGGGGGGGRGFDNMATLGDDLEEIEWGTAVLSGFTKDFYDEDVRVKRRTVEEVEKFRSDLGIQISGDNIKHPITTFQEACFPDYLYEKVMEQNFDGPTPIQAQGWPIALSGRDMVGISATGSGKTIAFALPAMIHINAQPVLEEGEGPIVLILAPTRELACQIQLECVRFGHTSKIKNCAIYGGAPRSVQVARLQDGPEIVIATPGRLLDMLQSKVTNLKRCTYVVLDEADRMLDFGFEPQIRKILSQVRPERQVLMFSATWPSSVQNLASDFLNDMAQVTVGSTDTCANPSITQHVKIVSGPDEKLDNLRILLDQANEAVQKVLIFVEKKEEAEELTTQLRHEGYPALAIHGNKEQPERDWVLSEFKSAEHPIMVATDVAARGLDVKDVGHVVVYTMPNNIEDYVHRIGRTGRAGEKGESLVFIENGKTKTLKDLIRVLKEAKQEVDPELEALAESGRAARACRNCGGDGHRADACTEERQERPRACFNCGEEGHSKADCTEPRKPRDINTVKCNACGEMGHYQSKCPQGGDSDGYGGGYGNGGGYGDAQSGGAYDAPPHASTSAGKSNAWGADDWGTSAAGPAAATSGGW